MWHASALFELFYGNLPLEEYIEKYICHQEATRWSFVYVHQLLITENNSEEKRTLNSSMPLKLSHLQCFNAVYHNQINDSQLLSNLNSIHFQYSEILTVINVQHSSSALLAQMLTTLNWLYIKCSRCLPLLLLLSTAHPSSVRRALPSAQLNSTFPLRAVLSFSHPSPKVLHLNPVLDGCAQTTGLFAPENSADFGRLKTKKCHLNNSRLTIAVNEDQPHTHVIFDRKNPQNGAVFFGNNFTSETSLLEMLQRRYHFRYRLLYAEQLYSARYNASQGRWTGTVGYVYSGAAHLGISGLSVTPARWKLVDFTTYTEFDYNAPLTRYPGLASRQWLALQPFTGLSWLLIFVCFGVTLFTVLCFGNISFKGKNGKKLSSFSLGSSVEALYRMLLKSSTNITHLKFFPSIRWPLAAWILVCLVLSNAFSAVFYSLLTLPQTGPTVETVEQFLEYINANPQLELVTNFYMEDLIFKSGPENELFYRIRRRFNDTKIRVFIDMADFLPLAQRVVEGRAVVILSRIFVNYLVYNYGLAIGHQARENLNLETLAFALPKRSPLLQPFNWAIQNLHEMGLTECFLQRSFQRKVVYRSSKPEVQAVIERQQEQHAKWWAEYRNRRKNGHQITSLSLIDLQSVLVLWCIGVALSVAAFLAEMTFLSARNILFLFT